MSDYQLKTIIESHRALKGYTKSQLAKLINVSPAYITRLENGSKENPSLEIKMKLAKALDIDILELIKPEEYFADPGTLKPSPRRLKDELLNNVMHVIGNNDTEFETLKLTESEIIELTVKHYAEDVFENKYKYDELTKEDYEELKPVIHNIVEMFLKNKSK